MPQVELRQIVTCPRRHRATADTRSRNSRGCSGRGSSPAARADWRRRGRTLRRRRCRSRTSRRDAASPGSPQIAQATTSPSLRRRGSGISPPRLRRRVSASRRAARIVRIKRRYADGPGLLDHRLGRARRPADLRRLTKREPRGRGLVDGDDGETGRRGSGRKPPSSRRRRRAAVGAASRGRRPTGCRKSCMPRPRTAPATSNRT